MSLDLMGIASENPFKVLTIFSCVNITPLGTPVEPLVYIIMAVSLDLGGELSAKVNKILIRSAVYSDAKIEAEENRKRNLPIFIDSPFLMTSLKAMMLTSSRKPDVSVSES